MEDKKTVLFNCARELFATKGFKDTNIAAITELAGFSVGTFYNYYPSKEKLFMEIFLEENAKLKKAMLASIDPSSDPVKLVRQALAFNLAGIKSNPILCHWYNRDVFEKIERLFREEHGIETVDFLYGDFLKMVEQWQAEGKMRSDLDSRFIMTIFAALINIDAHKEEIGLEYFPQLLDCITEFVMKGLTSCSDSRIFRANSIFMEGDQS